MLNQKYKKTFKKRYKNYSFNKINQNIMGLRVLESCRVTPKQLEAIRRVFVRNTKREGRFFIRMQINKSTTKKSKGSRMGKGVGSIDSWVIDIKPGQVVFEFTYFNDKVINDFLAGIKSKMPAKYEIIKKENFLNVA